MHTGGVKTGASLPLVVIVAMKGILSIANDRLWGFSAGAVVPSTRMIGRGGSVTERKKETGKG